MKEVSVIIAAYNGRRYLQDCLDTVLQETGEAGEVIVVDDASTDGSGLLVQERYPDVTLLLGTETRGFAAACNRGAAAARGAILVFLNQDTRVCSGWLGGLVRGLDGNPEVGLVTSKVLLMSQPDRIHLCGQDVHYTGLAFGRGLLASRDGYGCAEDVAAVSGASFAIRRELWEALGGFDEIFHMYYEETDLCWRAQLAGRRCRYVPDSVAYHDFRPGQPSPSRMYYTARNRYVLLLKNWRWRTLLLLAPALLLAEAIEWVLALAQGWRGLAAKARADLWVVTHLGEFRRLHGVARIWRRTPDAAILRARTDRLEPRVVTGGPAGRVLSRLADILFLANHRAALWLCRLLGL